MQTHYEQLQQKINSYKKELDLKEIEEQFLIKNHNRLTKEEYNESINKIKNEKVEIIQLINKSEEILATYDIVVNTNLQIENLIKLYDKEQDEELKDKLLKEIDKKRVFVKEKMENYLPENLVSEIESLGNNTTLPVTNTEENKNNSLVDSKLLELSGKKEKYNNLLIQANDKLNASTKRMMYIFIEEQKIRESHGLFETEKELDDFINYYMNLKQKQEEIILENKRNIKQIQKNISYLDRKIKERTSIIEEAKLVDMMPDEYENIINKINKRDTSDKLLKELGLTELVDKKNKLLASSNKELDKYKDKIKKSLIEKQKADNLKKLMPQLNIKNLPSEYITGDNNKLTNKNIENLLDNFNNEQSVNNTKVNNNENYGYKTIMSNLLDGLNPKEKDGIRYMWNNIQINNDFLKELKDGKYKYNVIHAVPHIIKLPIQFMKYLSSKITYSKKTKERMDTIEDRLNSLSEKDLNILLDTYCSDRSKIEKYGMGVSILINERLTKLVNEKEQDVNKKLQIKYNDVEKCFNDINVIDKLIKDNKLPQSQRDAYIRHRKKILAGKADEIESIRRDYEEKNEYKKTKVLLSTGRVELNKNSHIIKLIKTNWLLKNRNIDVTLINKEKELEKKRLNAIINGDDESALKAFMEAQSLENKNFISSKSR